MKMDRADAREQIRAFVLRLNPHLNADDLRDDTPLIANRLITSSHVLDLLLLIESIRKKPVDPRSLQPNSFADIDAIGKHLLLEAA